MILSFQTQIDNLETIVYELNKLVNNNNEESCIYYDNLCESVYETIEVLERAMMFQLLNGLEVE